MNKFDETDLLPQQEITLIGVVGKMGSGKDTTARVIQFLTQKNNEISIEDMLRLPAYYQPPTSEWEIKKYAGKLKQCVSLITGISLMDLEKEDVKNSYLGPEWDQTIQGMTTDPRTGNIVELIEQRRMTVRRLFQQFGTEGGRSIHKNFWVNALFSDYKPTIKNQLISDENAGKIIKPKTFKIDQDEYNIPHWIISDCRFPNEVDAVTSRKGLIIKVVRDVPFDIIANDQHYNRNNHESETALDDCEFKYVIDNNGGVEELVENVRNILREEKII